MLSSGQDFGKKLLDSKHVLKVYFKPRRKNQKLLFFPLCSVVVGVRILHLIEFFEKVFRTGRLIEILFKNRKKLCRSMEISQRNKPGPLIETGRSFVTLHKIEIILVF